MRAACRSPTNMPRSSAPTSSAPAGSTSDGKQPGGRVRRPAVGLPPARDRPSERRAVHRPSVAPEARHGAQEGSACRPAAASSCAARPTACSSSAPTSAPAASSLSRRAITRKGVAIAAKRLGIAATIVMPSDAPAVKRAATLAQGARIVDYDRRTESREEIAARLAGESGATLVPSFDDVDIIEGQGSAGVEIARTDARSTGALPDKVLVCCGGGGLSAGIALALPEPRSSPWSRKAGTTWPARLSRHTPCRCLPMRRRPAATRFRPSSSRR
jgi:hypothetical protein